MFCRTGSLSNPVGIEHRTRSSAIAVIADRTSCREKEGTTVKKLEEKKKGRGGKGGERKIRREGGKCILPVPTCFWMGLVLTEAFAASDTPCS